MTNGVAPEGGGPRATGARSVAARTIGVAVTGDNARVVMLPASAVRWAREVEAPPGAGNLPESASGVFVGRQDELAELRRMLTDQGEAAVTQISGVRAVHGLGGIGKSTLALRYAHTYRREYTLVWWINATSTEQIVTGLAGLASWLCPQWAAIAGVQERAAWAILWLQWHPGWLLVFDNVEDPADLRHYLGTLPDGHHLATSRIATSWHKIAPTMALGLLDSETAVDLLCTLAFGPQHTPTPEQRQDATALAADLGHLALALEQAGAYLYETGTSLADYRQMLGQVMDTAAGGIDPERTIARIWHQNLTAIEHRSQQAVTLLHAMAWLAPEDIPRSLLAPLCPNPLTLGEALGALYAYNMIAYSTDRQSLNVHRLVQTVMRHQPTDSDGHLLGRQDAEHLIRHATPDGGTNPSHWERLLPHVIAVADSTPSRNPASTKIADSYSAAADYLDDQGRNAQAIPLHKAALAQYKQVFGDTHADTLTSRNNLASAYQEAGNLKRATALYEINLVQRKKVLGDTHPDTLTSRNNLASVYQEAGNLKRATPLFETVLTQCEQVLGDTHPQTLHSRKSLAYAYQKAGAMERAIALFETVLTQCEQAFGDTHPQTLGSRNNLALAYQEAGDLTRATPLLETALAQYEEVFGGTHPHTLTTRHNLALAYRDAGDLERATPLLETTLAQRKQVLGDTHPHTLSSRNNLATAYQKAGNLKRATPLFETVLTQCEQVLGDTHPQTLHSRKALAYAYQKARDMERAITLFEIVLTQCEEVLGDTQPQTLGSRNNLALAYQEAGDLTRAIPLFETALAQYDQVLGDTHPYTLICRNNLARARRAAQSINEEVQQPHPQQSSTSD
ncbi:tetratricopeptide repeat protein [Streptomyces sp. NPDC127113]|uniref:tetratricopeptide repeat protein n=1 Tax=unclassified Streptomyces TaxID=2593676 RepID=UPI0033B07077